MSRAVFCPAVLVAFALVALLGQGVSAQDSDKPDKPAAASDTAVIVHSGSTNTTGYRLNVDSSGNAEWSVFRRQSVCPSHKGKLAADLTQKFFNDLRTLAPLDQMPAAHCAKSASFGTTIRVVYQGSTSSDLSCPAASPEAGKLSQDIAEITASLGIRPGMRASTCDESQPLPVR